MNNGKELNAVLKFHWNNSEIFVTSQVPPLPLTVKIWLHTHVVYFICQPTGWSVSQSKGIDIETGSITLPIVPVSKSVSFDRLAD